MARVLHPPTWISSLATPPLRTLLVARNGVDHVLVKSVVPKGKFPTRGTAFCCRMGIVALPNRLKVPSTAKTCCETASCAHVAAWFGLSVCSVVPREQKAYLSW